MIRDQLRRARGLWIGMLSFAVTAAIMIAAAPAAQAQAFSDSYTFIKAVRDADGDKVTAMLNRAGTTVVNSRDSGSGDGALHIVVKRRDATWLAFLLTRGANPELRDDQGNTPLIVAAQIGFGEGAALLLSGRAGVNTANSRGETPLIVAVQMRNVALVRQLLAAGANLKQTDNVAGLSARDYAQRDARAAAILKLIDAAPPAKSAKMVGPTR